MPKFSMSSLNRLKTVCRPLRDILNDAIKQVDFTVISGHRGRDAQNKLYREGRSKLKYPHSKHNTYPSLAVDIAPYPINWNDHRRFYLLAGVILRIAYERNVAIRWGGDWNMNWLVDDESFKDLGHFEVLLDERGEVLPYGSKLF